MSLKIQFTVDDIKRYSNFDQTLQDIILETPDKELASYLEELNYIIDEIEAKIRWSGLIITEDLNSEQLNIARALYVYKVQSHIQEYTLNRKQQMENLSKRKLTLNIPLNSQAVIPREETKTQADLIVKYFNEKDLDYSKNKRKPISFRKSFI